MTGAALTIRADRVGTTIARRDVMVTFRESAAYAAAIGAERDVYLDDRTPGGALAPPPFITALEWPVISGTDGLAAIGVDPEQLFSVVLHAFQDTWFHRPIRAGDRLHMEAVLASVRQTGSGVLTVTRIVSTDAQSAPVAESWFGAFFRGAVAPSRHTCDAPTLTPWEGPTHDETRLPPLSRARAHIYAECARLWNPIHTEPGFATALGLPDIALHGSLLWAMAGEVAIDRSMGGDPTRLRRLAMRFNRPILPGPGMILRLGGVCGHEQALSLWTAQDGPVAEGSVYMVMS